MTNPSKPSKRAALEAGAASLRREWGRNLMYGEANTVDLSFAALLEEMADKEEA